MGVQGDEGQPLAPGHITLLREQRPQDRSKLGTQWGPKFSWLRRELRGSRVLKRQRRPAASCHAPASAGRAGAGHLRCVSPSPRARAGLSVPIPERGVLPPTQLLLQSRGAPASPLATLCLSPGPHGAHCTPTAW